MTQKTTDAFIPLYPDMKLYQEIIFLQHHFIGKWLVENVTPYYEPLIQGKKIGRHIYWSNFNLPSLDNVRKVKMCRGINEVQELSKFHDYDFNKYKGKQRRDKIARNLVDFEVGKKIIETALGIVNREDIKQLCMFP